MNITAKGSSNRHIITVGRGIEKDEATLFTTLPMGNTWARALRH
jgi:hypothetical protein